MRVLAFVLLLVSCVACSESADEEPPFLGQCPTITGLRPVDVLLPSLVSTGGPATRLDAWPVVISSAAAFEAEYGVAAPSSVDFSRERLLVLGSPDSLIAPALERFGFCDEGGLEVEVVERQLDGCEMPLIHPGAYRVLAFPAAGTPVAVDSGSGEFSTERVSCSVQGALRGELCSREQSCTGGTVCTGLTTSTSGVCAPATLQARFGTSIGAVIPDGDASGVVLENTVAGFEGVIADLMLVVHLEHPRPDSLRVRLTSATGRSLELEPIAGGSPPVWIVERMAGDDPNGTWTLQIVDPTPAQSGEVTGWELLVMGRPAT